MSSELGASQESSDSLGYRNDVEIVHSHVEEARRAQCHDGRANITVRDNLDTKDIGYRPSSKTKL
jgi:hypothetical protein